MTSFRVAALLLPAAGAFLAPALWSWRPGWKAAAIGHAALLAIVATWGLAAGGPGSAILAAAAMSTAFTLFALGLHLAVGQVLSGWIVIALNATLFLAPSLVRDAVERNESHLAQARVDNLLAVNPWAVLAAGPFKLDLFRDLPSMYRSSHAADYADARPPAWPGVAGGYALGGALLIGAVIAARRWRRPATVIHNPP